MHRQMDKKILIAISIFILTIISIFGITVKATDLSDQTGTCTYTDLGNVGNSYYGEYNCTLE